MFFHSCDWFYHFEFSIDPILFQKADLILTLSNPFSLVDFPEQFEFVSNCYS